MRDAWFVIGNKTWDSEFSIASSLAILPVTHHASRITPLCVRATDGHFADFDRRQADSYRNLLAFFAAYADAEIKLQIVADGVDALERFRAIASQRRALYRRGDFAVFNQ